MKAIDIAAVNQSEELSGHACRLGYLRLNRAQGFDEPTILSALWYLGRVCARQF